MIFYSYPRTVITMASPMSESFSTIVDSAGNNRIIIDTDAAPWTTMNANEMAAKFLLECCIVFGLTHSTPPLEMMLILINTHMSLLKFDDPVTGDEPVTELWEKVVNIEKAVMLFLRMTELDCLDSFAPYFDLVVFVKQHTRGYVYKMAASIVNQFNVCEITSAPRRWKCPICYEKYRENHMCHSFSCGHLVHFSCNLEMNSSECPVCRTLD